MLDRLKDLFKREKKLVFNKYDIFNDNISKLLSLKKPFKATYSDETTKIEYLFIEQEKTPQTARKTATKKNEN